MNISSDDTRQNCRGKRYVGKRYNLYSVKSTLFVTALGQCEVRISGAFVDSYTTVVAADQCFIYDENFAIYTKVI